MANSLEIRLLGGLEFLRDGIPLEGFVSNKVPALVAYLSMSQRPLSRDILAALLWGELAEADARNNLRQALSNLRRLLEPYIIITRETVTFNHQQPYWLDVEHFTGVTQNAATTPGIDHLIQAVSWYQGDFMEGVFLREAPDYEDWMLAQRTRLRELAVQALQELAEYHYEQRMYDQALVYAARLLALDAWREEVHRLLMLIQVRSGQRSAALAQYETCRSILEQELGVEPATATKALYERIRIAQDTPRHNLPATVTAFVGRYQAMDGICRQLTASNCRLLTITGLGGMGKTRLALACADALVDHFINGVSYISLVNTTPDTLLYDMATALAIPLADGRDLKIAIFDYLKGQERLLVLDNAEHLVAATGLWGDLLKTAPDVKLLVTSRERLNLSGEWVHDLHGLDVVVPEHQAPSDDFDGALGLFVQAARRFHPKFELKTHEVAAATDICRLVDGMPLGIELAAAWIRTLDVLTIAAHIEQGMDFLSSRYRDVPARQQSLRAVFESSWQQLSPIEKSVFQKSAVFQGGFTLLAAEEVTGATAVSLLSLVDKSLVQRNAEGRYDLHEVTRQFAYEQLQISGEYAHTRDAHTTFFLRQVEDLFDELQDERQAKAVNWMKAELPNLRAMWAYACEERRWQDFREAAHVVYSLYERIGRYEEGISLINQLLAALGPGKDQPLIRAFAYNRRGGMLWRLGRLQDALASFQSALPFTDGGTSQAMEEQANALHMIGTMQIVLGDYHQSVEPLTSALKIWQTLNNPLREVRVLQNLAAAEWGLGDLENARHHYRICYDRFIQLDNLSGAAMIIDNLGGLELNSGNLDLALELRQQAVRLIQPLNNHARELSTRSNLADTHYLRGELQPAWDIFQDILPSVRHLGVANPLLVVILRDMGVILLDRGDRESAHVYIQEALTVAQATGSTALILSALTGFAAFFIETERLDDGTQLGQFILAHAAADDYTRLWARRALERANKHLKASYGRVMLTDYPTTVESWSALVLRRVGFNEYPFL